MLESDFPMQFRPLGRRAFLQGSTLLLTASTLQSPLTWAEQVAGNADQPVLQIGLLTDMHYADKAPAGTRHYRETLDKLAEAGEKFAAEKIDSLIELGDFIDAADTVDTELGYLKTIQARFAPLCADRHYVLGNHCVDTLSKQEFLGTIEREQSYYSFDRGGYHCIILDACFRSDGEPYQRKNFTWTDPNLHPAEVEWLQADLAATELPVLVFVHQRLDVSNQYGIKNAAEVRKLLEQSGRVRAVFQGHSHKNDLIEIAGIPYCTLVAMVEGSGAESSGYSILRARANGTLELTGFRKQNDRRWVK